MTAGDPHQQHRLPAVDRVLGWSAVAALVEAHGRQPVLDAVRGELAAWRASGEPADDTGIVACVEHRVVAAMTPSQVPVFNLTGTVLHTNLGRAPLPPEAIEAVVRVTSGASNVEYDLESGKRGDRDAHVESWLQRLTGAEAATVVNNNAAAVMLMLNTLAQRRQVVVSRGELIEIGGAFRLPDIMARAGCKLHEVGTTNRTHLPDYAQAMGSRPAMVMKVHTSNYRIEGFTAAPQEHELAQLTGDHAIPFAVDLGAGTLVDLTRYGLPHEPTPREALTAGADLVTFSGDKLLGGPQAGVIAGRADLIARIRRNPMKRAMRCDRMTLAALEAVLRLYADPDSLCHRVPTLRLLTRPEDTIRQVAVRLQPTLAKWLADEPVRVDHVTVASQIGSGSLPVDRLPSHAVRIQPAARRGAGRLLGRIAARLRRLPVPVIGRIADGALLLDMRCLDDEHAFSAQLEENQRP